MRASYVYRGVIAMTFADVEPRAPSNSYNVSRGLRGPTLERPTNVATLASSASVASCSYVGSDARRVTSA